MSPSSIDILPDIITPLSGIVKWDGIIIIAYMPSVCYDEDIRQIMSHFDNLRGVIDETGFIQMAKDHIHIFTRYRERS